jgi:glycosyltransferase involved in cell wall biosynthesis
VVTDIEANHEWIEDGVNGFLVPVDRPAVVADRLIRALGDAALREAARQRNLQLIRERASWRDNMDEVCELFARLVAERGGRGGRGGRAGRGGAR